MRLGKKLITELQRLLKEQTGNDYTDEEAQRAGLAIMRFMLAKKQRGDRAVRTRGRPAL